MQISDLELENISSEDLEILEKILHSHDPLEFKQYIKKHLYLYEKL